MNNVITDFHFGQVPSSSVTQSPQTINHKQLSKAVREASERKAKKLHFYQNGRPYDSKLTVSIIPGKEFISLEQLYEYLTDKSKLLNGVNQIFTVNGVPIKSLDEFEHDQNYVLSSNKNFIRFDYGTINCNSSSITAAKRAINTVNNKFKTNKYEHDLRLIRPLSSKFNNIYASNHLNHKSLINNPTNNLIQRQNIHSFEHKLPQQQTTIYSVNRDIRTVTIVNNKNHDIRTKVILNLKTPKSFDLLLNDLGDSVQIKSPKVMFTSNGQMVNSISQLKHELFDINLFYIDNEYPHEPLSLILARTPTPKGYQSPIDNNCSHCNGFPFRQQLESLNSQSLLINVNQSQSNMNDNHNTFTPEQTNRRINRQTQKTNQRISSPPALNISVPIFVDRKTDQQSINCDGQTFDLNQIPSEKYQQIQSYAEKLLNDTSLQIQNEGLLSPRVSPVAQLKVVEMCFDTESSNTHNSLLKQPSKAEKNRRESIQFKHQKQQNSAQSLPKNTSIQSNTNQSLVKEKPIIISGPIRTKNAKVIDSLKRPTIRRNMENMFKSNDNLANDGNLSNQSKHSKRSLPVLNQSIHNKQKTKPIIAAVSNDQHKQSPQSTTKRIGKTSNYLKTNPINNRNGGSVDHLNSLSKQPRMTNKSKSFLSISNQNEPLDASSNIKRKPSNLQTKQTIKSLEKNLHGTLSPPNYCLQLDKIFGFNGKQSENLVYLKTGELAFYTGVFAILWYHQTGKQRFYCEHEHDICCLRVDANCEFIATANVHNSTMMIRIWSVKTLKTIKILTNNNKCHLIDMKFSTNNSLFTLNGGNESMISLWNWRLKINIANTTKSLDNNEQLYGLTVHPTETDIVVTYGKMHLVVWHFKQDRSIDSRTALQMQSKIIKTIQCAAFLQDNSLLTGDSQGNLTIWAPFEVDNVLEFAIKEVKAHDIKLTCFKLTSENILISGDQDGVIKTWDVNDNEFRLLNAIKLPSLSGSITAITQPIGHKTDEIINIFVATSNNFILKGSALATDDYQIIFEGHNMAIRTCSLDNKNNIYTASLDRKICKWNDSGLVWKTDSSIQAMSSSVHPIGKILAVGSATGIITIVNTGSGQPIQYIQLTTVCIGCMSYSPNGDFLAAGCQDGCLHVIPVRDNGHTYDKVSILKGPLPILTLQWSMDTQFILTSVDDNNYQELILWDLPNTRYIRNVTSFSDNLHWYNVTCSGLEDARGTWDNDQLKNVINICKHYSPSSKSIITGDENGFIRLFAYPCYDTKASYFQYKLCDGSITDVKFSVDETFVASTNFDGTIFIWRLIDYSNKVG